MGRVKIFTDSTADLSKELLERHDIGVIPLYVTIGEGSFKDGVELTAKEMYEYMEREQVLPKTSAPTVEDFASAFAPWDEEGYSIVYVGLSSKLSSTCQSAALAAREFEQKRVWVVDSLNLSTGIGLLALEAADMAGQGMSAVDIVHQLELDIPKVRSSFVIDTLKYLHMGGRCTSVQLLASNVLKIRPQIVVAEGSMVVGSKYRGNRKRSLEHFWEDHVGDGRQIRPHRVFITHSQCPEDEIEYLKSRLQKELGFDNVYVTSAGCVISSHCGPRTIGILYLER